jgi:probable HAF family extracellular repeat protein
MKIRLILSAFGWQSSQPKKICYRAALSPLRIATAGTLMLVAAGLVCVAANPNRSGPPKLGLHHHYQLIDLGTLGGPQSTIDFAIPLNNHGTVSGSADTPHTNPYYGNDNPAFFPDPYIEHAFQWKNGALTDLGSLPGGGTSQPNCINNRGDVAGNASNNVIDPIGGWPESRAVLYKDDQVLDLGTIDGGSESAATCINDKGVIVGFAGDNTLDPFSLSGWGTQTHAFRWTKSQGVQDLGTLGGPDAVSIALNDAGQIAGFSYTNSIPNPTTGSPTLDPFLWENGQMTDLGGLGGTLCDSFFGPTLNRRGHVAGDSNLQEDVSFHPFLWTKAGGMQDLGTLGGSFGSATWIDDEEEVVGWAFTNGDQVLLAFLWKDGIMTNLGTVDGDGCSVAWFSREGQAVGQSNDCTGIPPGHAFLWENGSIVDLNSLIPPGSGVQLTLANHINEQGEITVAGVLSNGNNHAFLLIPCDEEHPGVEGCDYSLVGANVVPSVQPAVHEKSASMPPAAPWQRNNRFHFPGRVIGPGN